MPNVPRVPDGFLSALALRPRIVTVISLPLTWRASACQMSRGKVHVVWVVYATRSLASSGEERRISQKFSADAATKRKRGRAQFLGSRAPGLSPDESCGS